MTNRWNFITGIVGNSLKLEAIPDVSEMGKYIYESSQKLQSKILEQEETLILAAMSNEALIRLKDKCIEELTKREKLRNDKTT